MSFHTLTDFIQAHYTEILAVMPAVTIYGAWDGNEENNQMLQRGATSLAQLAGLEYRILWPTTVNASRKGERQYLPGSDFNRMPRGLDIEEAGLPAGTYYLEYEVDDMFLRPYCLEQIEMHWDGENLTFPDNLAWEGTALLNWPGDQSYHPVAARRHVLPVSYGRWEESSIRRIAIYG